MKKLKPVTTEKAVMKIEIENTLSFVVDKKANKSEIKKQIEDIFEVEVEKVKTLIRNNKKYAYVKLKPKFKAIDLATKLGVM